MNFYLFFLNMYNLIFSNDRIIITMPKKMIYDINTKNDCIFPNAKWRRVMERWPILSIGQKMTQCIYNEDFKSLSESRPKIVSNIRYETEYTFRDCPYNMVTRDINRTPDVTSEFDREVGDFNFPKVITKVEAYYGENDVRWDTERFLRYAGPRYDFHDAKDIQMMDLFDSDEECPEHWLVFMLTAKEPILIMNDDFVNRQTLVQDRT